MKKILFLNLEFVVYQIVLIIVSLSTSPIPPQYASSDNMDVFNSLKATVRHELHIVEYTKNIGHNTSGESIFIVLDDDKIITSASKKHDVPKEMIQAVLFKELRMIDFRDDISDFFVDNCYKINRDFSEISNTSIYACLITCITNTKGSSTGIGQIFPETAIKAHNWYCSKNENLKNDCIDCKDILQREKMWRSLQDDETSINFIALILKYEAAINLNIDINNASDDDIKRLFVRYNGATYYGDEVFKYYELFGKIEPA